MLPRSHGQSQATVPEHRGAEYAELRPVETFIRVMRGQKIILDADLAALYKVPTKVLNQAVRRNLARFPADFMFKLSPEEVEALRSQSVTLEKHAVNPKGRGRHTKFAPYAFTEQGVSMLSAVLRSPRAVQMSIFIVRAFIRMREIIAANRDLALRVQKVEAGHERIASVIEILVDDMQMLAAEVADINALPEPKKRRIGFRAPHD